MLKPRKRLVKAKLKEDNLLIYSAKSQQFFRENWKSLVYGVAAILVVVVVAGFINMTQNAKESDAAYEELLARDAFMQADYEEALKHIDIIQNDFSGTRSATMALFLKGRIHQQRGEYPQAEELFHELANRHKDQPYLAFSAYNALGVIASGNKNYEEAAKNYQAAATHFPTHFNAAVALLDAGDCMKKLSRYEEAKRIYKSVISKYPKARVADQARNNLAELEFLG